MKPATVISLSLVGALLAGSQPALQAADFNLDWRSVGGGGGASGGGAYSLSGTVTQAGGGAMVGGNLRLVSGFWSVVAAVPTPGAPPLTITRTTTGTLAICWPSTATGFVLQQNSDLRTTNWAATGLTPTDNGTVKCVLISPPAGTLFFRLAK